MEEMCHVCLGHRIVKDLNKATGIWEDLDCITCNGTGFIEQKEPICQEHEKRVAIIKGKDGMGSQTVTLAEAKKRVEHTANLLFCNADDMWKAFKEANYDVTSREWGNYLIKILMKGKWNE